MKQDLILHHLEELAEKLSIKILYEDLKKEGISSKGGLCKVKGEDRIIINKNLTIAEKVDMLTDELSKFNTDQIYLPPAVKEILGKKTLKNESYENNFETKND